MRQRLSAREVTKDDDYANAKGDISSPWKSSHILLALQIVWMFPYVFTTNYLERSLLPFRLLCYTDPDLLSIQRPLRENTSQCIETFFGAERMVGGEETCLLNDPSMLRVLRQPSKLFESVNDRVLVVRSAPGAVDYRNYVRASWKAGVERIANTSVIFICGRSSTDDNLDREIDIFDDILQFDFLDSYRNLTLKMMLTYRFFLERTPIQQILVINDDTIVNATAMNRFVGSALHGARSSYLIGKVSRGYPRLFFPWLPWYVSSSVYPHKCYPPFTQGSSFMISREAAARIVESICRFPFVHLDDVLMGIVTNCLSIRNIHSEGFDQHNLNDDFIVFHYQYTRYSASRMMELFHSVEHRL